MMKLAGPFSLRRLRGGSGDASPQPENNFPSYIGITDVSTKSHEHMRVEAFADGQASILADEPTGFNIGDPVQLKGQSRGWTPVHYQLAGLATCTSITIAVVARDQGFKYRGLRTAARSLIDIRGFFFDLHLQPKFEQINFDLWLDTDESDARIKALADETDRRCPQLCIYRLAKVRDPPRYIYIYSYVTSTCIASVSIICLHIIARSPAPRSLRTRRLAHQHSIPARRQLAQAATDSDERGT